MGRKSSGGLGRNLSPQRRVADSQDLGAAEHPRPARYTRTRTRAHARTRTHKHMGSLDCFLQLFFGTG